MHSSRTSKVPELVAGLTHGAVTSVDPEGIKSAKDKGSSSSAKGPCGSGPIGTQFSFVFIGVGTFW